jgi:hypothetical protein
MNANKRVLLLVSWFFYLLGDRSNGSNSCGSAPSEAKCSAFG